MGWGCEKKKKYILVRKKRTFSTVRVRLGAMFKPKNKTWGEGPLLLSWGKSKGRKIRSIQGELPKKQKHPAILDKRNLKKHITKECQRIREYGD